MTVDLSKLYPEIGAIAGLLLDSSTGSHWVSTFIQHNPDVAAILGVVAFILNKFVNPPTVALASKV